MKVKVQISTCETSTYFSKACSNSLRNPNRDTEARNSSDPFRDTLRMRSYLAVFGVLDASDVHPHVSHSKSSTAA
jgi:hypothetical protein